MNNEVDLDLVNKTMDSAYDTGVSDGRLALLSSIQEELKKRHRKYNPLTGINGNTPELRPVDLVWNQALSELNDYLESLK